MKHVFITKIGDRATIIGLLEGNLKNSDMELIQQYNNSVKIGILGSHRQGQVLIALHHAFLKRFQKSPILFEENILISLTEPIFLHNGNWEYVQRDSVKITEQINKTLD
jgi:hypothetical protein